MVKIASIKMIADGYGIFHFPSGIRLSHENNMFYIADMYNHRICLLKEDGSVGALTNVIDGDRTCTSLGRPLAVWVTNRETLFTADAEHNKIFFKAKRDDVWRPIRMDPNISLNLPGGVAVDEKGNVYTNDFLNNRLIQVTPEGRTKILLEGEKNVSKPYGIFYQKNRIYYTDTGNGQICYIDLKHGRVHILNPKTEAAGLSVPIALALDEEGNIYICEQRSMYFLDIKKNMLSLIINKDIWKEQNKKNGIKNKICHIGAITVKNKGEIYWIDTIKECIYQIILVF